MRKLSYLALILYPMNYIHECSNLKDSYESSYFNEGRNNWVGVANIKVVQRLYLEVINYGIIRHVGATRRAITITLGETKLVSDHIAIFSEPYRVVFLVS